VATGIERPNVAPGPSFGRKLAKKTQTCLVGSLDVPCSDVGAKMRDQGIPLDAHIHLVADKDASYHTISAALVSLRDAGFRLKLGYIDANDRAK
jgi:biopolymer transport protein ExbD